MNEKQWAHRDLMVAGATMSLCPGINWASDTAAMLTKPIPASGEMPDAKMRQRMSNYFSSF